MTSESHFEDFEIIVPCVGLEGSAGESLPHDSRDSSSIYTEEVDDGFIEVVLNTPDASQHVEKSPLPPSHRDRTRAKAGLK
jgi:hypothetical protein